MSEVSISLALISGGTAAAGSFIANWLLQKHSHKIKQQAVRTALVEEIKAIKSISENRGYLDHLKQAAEYLATQPAETYSVKVKVPEHYSRIYQSLAAEIGNIEPAFAGLIVKFHHLVDAIVQDITPGGALYNGAKAHAYIEASEIYEVALETADEIIRLDNLRKKKCKPLFYRQS